MYWNHIIEKNAFYYTSQSNEPVIYNCAFYLRRVVYIAILNMASDRQGSLGAKVHCTTMSKRIAAVIEASGYHTEY